MVLIRWTMLQNREKITIHVHKLKVICRRLQNKASGTYTNFGMYTRLTEQYRMEEFACTQNDGFKP